MSTRRSPALVGRPSSWPKHQAKLLQSIAVLSGNSFEISRRCCAFLGDLSLLLFLGCYALACLVQSDQLVVRSLLYIHRSHGFLSLRLIVGRLRSSGDRRSPERPVPYGMVFHMTDRIAHANIMLGRLQECFRRHAVIRKPRLLREMKITLDQLLRRPSDLALCARALKDTVAGIALLLRRTGFATPSIVMRFHGPI